MPRVLGVVYGLSPKGNIQVPAPKTLMIGLGVH